VDGKITERLGKVTVRGDKRWKGKGGSVMTNVCLSMYSKTENIYYSQLSSVAILPQPEPVLTSYNTRKGLISLISCAIALRSSPPSQVSTCNGQRSSHLFCVHYTRNELPEATITKHLVYTSFSGFYIYKMLLLTLRKRSVEELKVFCWFGCHRSLKCETSRTQKIMSGHGLVY
jgi:hypothetical protein